MVELMLNIGMCISLCIDGMLSMCILLECLLF